MRKILSILLLALGIEAGAQEREILRAAMLLSGAGSEEEADESVVDMLESLRGRPERINSNRLRRSALLSNYQVAVIKDYRATYGDILSWTELSLLEGFTPEIVDALKPFLSLDSDARPGAVDSVRTKTQAMLRGTLSSAGGKVKVTGRSWMAGGAVRCSDGFQKWDGTFFGEASFGNHRVVAGDYKLRFAEGLGLWTGFSMESLSTVNAFLKRAQGISPVWSFTSSEVQRGLAYEYSSTSWRVQAFGSLDKTFGARGEYFRKHFQAGLTVASGLLVSADAKVNLRDLLLSGEAAYRKGAWAGKMAGLVPLGDAFRLAFQGRVIPSRYSGRKYGEYALAAGFDWVSEVRRQLSGATGFGSSVPAHKVSLTLDAAMLPLPGTDPRRIQVRGYGTWEWQMSPQWGLCFRLTERYRNYEAARTDLRSDFRFGSGPWLSVLRLEAVRCESWGLLGYLEGGYKKERSGRLSALAAYLRATGFVIDKWNDRIYVYERDAPGTFSVPAYYGRGVGVSAVGSAKWRLGGFARGGASSGQDVSVPRRDGSSSGSAVSSPRPGGFDLRVNLRAAALFRIGRPITPTLNLQLQCGF